MASVSPQEPHISKPQHFGAWAESCKDGHFTFTDKFKILFGKKTYVAEGNELKYKKLGFGDRCKLCFGAGNAAPKKVAELFKGTFRPEVAGLLEVPTAQKDTRIKEVNDKFKQLHELIRDDRPILEQRNFLDFKKLELSPQELRECMRKMTPEEKACFILQVIQDAKDPDDAKDPTPDFQRAVFAAIDDFSILTRPFLLEHKNLNIKPGEESILEETVQIKPVWGEEGWTIEVSDKEKMIKAEEKTILWYLRSQDFESIKLLRTAVKSKNFSVTPFIGIDTYNKSEKTAFDVRCTEKIESLLQQELKACNVSSRDRDVVIRGSFNEKAVANICSSAIKNNCADLVLFLMATYSIEIKPEDLPNLNAKLNPEQRFALVDILAKKEDPQLFQGFINIQLENLGQYESKDAITLLEKLCLYKDKLPEKVRDGLLERAVSCNAATVVESLLSEIGTSPSDAKREQVKSVLTRALEKYDTNNPQSVATLRAFSKLDMSFSSFAKEVSKSR